MNPLIDFRIGLTDGIAWPWPIAVYLFLAGISGGALAVALLVRLYRGQKEVTPLLQSSSLIAFVTICLGMVCLVADLTNPLYFWRILVFYNPTSVMSLGVMALLVYIPVTAILTLVALRKELAGLLGGSPKAVFALLAWLERRMGALSWLGLVLALTICAYTGFLISALIRFPIINTAVLPALFVASGLSAGAASAKLVAAACFGAPRASHDLHTLHLAEWPIMAAEAGCIFMIAVALASGNAAAQDAFAAFFAGDWATEFWVGVVCVGFLVPLALAFARESAGTFYVSALASVAGMMCLRLFILYAGQINGIGMG